MRVGLGATGACTTDSARASYSEQVLIFWALYFTAVEIEHPFKPGSVSAKYEAVAECTTVQMSWPVCPLKSEKQSTHTKFC
eukprot:4169387-Amphidinium_carterae.1